MNQSLGSCKWSSSYQLQLIFPSLKTAAVFNFALSLLASLYFILLWYALNVDVVLPIWKELVNVSASTVRISKTAVNFWVKDIKSVCQVKDQPKIIHPVKNQSKYLVSQTFDRGQRSEYSGTSLIWLSFIRTLDYPEWCPEIFKTCNS